MLPGPTCHWAQVVAGAVGFLHVRLPRHEFPQVEAIALHNELANNHIGPSRQFIDDVWGAEISSLYSVLGFAVACKVDM